MDARRIACGHENTQGLLLDTNVRHNLFSEYRQFRPQGEPNQTEPKKGSVLQYDGLGIPFFDIFRPLMLAIAARRVSVLEAAILLLCAIAECWWNRERWTKRCCGDRKLDFSKPYLQLRKNPNHGSKRPATELPAEASEDLPRGLWSRWEGGISWRGGFCSLQDFCCCCKSSLCKYCGCCVHRQRGL